MSLTKAGIMLPVILVFIILAGSFCTSGGGVLAEDNTEIIYQLEARDSAGDIISSGLIRMDLTHNYIIYELEEGDHSGRITFESYSEAAGKAMTEFILVGLPETDIRLLSTLFFPLQFDLERLENEVDSGWYSDQTKTGFSFTDYVCFRGESALQGKFIYQGEKEVFATYREDRDYPVRLVWTDAEDRKYKVEIEE
ncbi:MAG: hypothetical protein ACQEQG_09310 [Bacillota bacterium]